MIQNQEFMQRTRGRGILKLWATATDGYFSIEIEQSQKKSQKIASFCKKVLFEILFFGTLHEMNYYILTFLSGFEMDFGS